MLYHPFQEEKNMGWHNFTIWEITEWADFTDRVDLKPMHNIGKVSVNASILYKNHEICNKTNLWKFQLISLFLLRENIKNAFSSLVFILMAGVFISRDKKLIIGSYFTNYSKTITHQGEIFQGKLSTIVIFIPCKLCVNLRTFLFFGLTNVVQGL